ncbi:MAG TPA: hypothetical protein VIL86_13010 [Tepidisphaeraceae bacterium]
MSVVPTTLIDRVQFYQNHITPWTANSTAIGTSSAAVTDLSTKTSAARDAFDAQQAAQSAAKAATLSYQTAVSAMSVAGAAIMKQIRAKGESTGNNSVYSLAEIPAPATPGPVGAPGEPSNFKVSLEVNGALTITWKCANPAGCTGTMYQVFRRTSADGEFAYLGGSGEKKFVDATIPAGSSQVTYQMQAVRSTAAGPWAQFNVNFGAGSGSGGMTAAVETVQAVKRAA